MEKDLAWRIVGSIDLIRGIVAIQQSYLDANGMHEWAVAYQALSAHLLRAYNKAGELASEIQ